jgi:hypothetical protein
MRGVHLLHQYPPPGVIANEAPSNKEVLIFTRATMLTMRRTIPEIKTKGAMPTNMTPIKGANIISKVGAVHVMEGSVLQITVATVVDNAVPTRKWSSLEVTFVIISVPI